MLDSSEHKVIMIGTNDGLISLFLLRKLYLDFERAHKFFPLSRLCQGPCQGGSRGRRRNAINPATATSAWLSASRKHTFNDKQTVGDVSRTGFMMFSGTISGDAKEDRGKTAAHFFVVQREPLCTCSAFPGCQTDTTAPWIGLCRSFSLKSL